MKDGFPPLQAKLIFSPAAGATPANESARLRQWLEALAAVNIHVDMQQVESADEATAAAARGVRMGFSMIIACGGDGTVASVANALVKTPVQLGILPGGTRNNIARSLGIPLKLRDAVRLLRTGRPHKIGAGLARVGERQRWFLETFTVGLFSALYPHADALQKGDLRQVRGLLTTFMTAPAAQMHIVVDDLSPIEVTAHAMIGVNMPSTGAFFRLAGDIAYDDEHLDIFLYDRLDKLDFLVYGFDVLTGMPEDPAVQRIRARHATIRCRPHLPVMADGFDLGAGDVEVHMEADSLTVISGKNAA